MVNIIPGLTPRSSYLGQSHTSYSAKGTLGAPQLRALSSSEYLTFPWGFLKPGEEPATSPPMSNALPLKGGTLPQDMH